MLRLKVLKGPLAGQSISLKQGENTIGRVPERDIVLESPGVSKLHAKIVVQGEQCVISDQGSSNGTFVNGAKVKDRILRIGDKIAFHDVVVELAPERQVQMQTPSQRPTSSMPQMPPAQGWNNGIAYQQQPGMPPFGQPFNMGGPQMQAQAQVQGQSEPQTFAELMKSYVERVILPGVYYLAEVYPLKTVLAGFLLAFILMVTLLSSIPMAQLTKDGIQKESLRRALSIARNLAAVSEKTMSAGTEATVRTDFAENEDGVQQALVIARDDGHIIAPVTKSEYPDREKEFVAAARKQEETYYRWINGTTIGVAVPIKSFSQEAGAQVIAAFAVVIYKMDTLDWSATTGVFARVLIIALVLGSLIYYLMYKLISYPVVDATEQLDLALRGEKDQIDSKYEFMEFQALISNINSAVARMGSGGNNGNQASAVDRTGEASNLVRIISDAAFALDGNGVFAQVNNAFEDLVGMRQLTLQGQTVDSLQDQALKLSLEDLMQRGKAQPGTIVTNDLEINGVNYEIDMQVSVNSQNPGIFDSMIGTIKRRSA